MRKIMGVLRELYKESGEKIRRSKEISRKLSSELP